MAMSSTVWHVLFDGKPEIVTHVCVVHRELGLLIGCPHGDINANGDCAHVQTRLCECIDPPACPGCWENSTPPG